MSGSNFTSERTAVAGTACIVQHNTKQLWLRFPSQRRKSRETFLSQNSQRERKNLAICSSQMRSDANERKKRRRAHKNANASPENSRKGRKRALLRKSCKQPGRNFFASGCDWIFDSNGAQIAFSQRMTKAQLS